MTIFTESYFPTQNVPEYTGERKRWRAVNSTHRENRVPIFHPLIISLFASTFHLPKGGGRGRHIHSSHTHDSHWTNKKKKKIYRSSHKITSKIAGTDPKVQITNKCEKSSQLPGKHTTHTRSRSNWPDLRWFRSHGTTCLRFTVTSLTGRFSVTDWLTGGKTESAERSGHYSTTRALQERWYELDSSSDRLYMTERLNFAQKRRKKRLRGSHNSSR